MPRPRLVAGSPLSAGYHFFAGKGGVGKTSCAAATALREAERGRDVLLVSIDPAHSLGDALSATLGPEPADVPVRGRGRLRALEMDADAALEAWIAERRVVLREIAARGTYLAPAEIDRFFELALPGVDELVALLELERLRASLGPELVVVDTAPTGHALRMLAMPTTLRQVARVLDDMQEKHRVLASALAGGSYRDDAADRLIADIDAQAQDVIAILRDPQRASVSWVALPEMLSVEETHDGTTSLSASGIEVREIIVNHVTPAPPSPCALCDARREEERSAVARLAEIARAPMRLVPHAPSEPRGVAALRALGAALTREDRGRPMLSSGARRSRSARPRARPPNTVGFAAPERIRVVLFGGKGGVGKTTCAAAAAISIAERHPDRRVLLLSTDPAHSMGDALELTIGDRPVVVPGVRGQLDARELDAGAELARRREQYASAVDRLFDALRGGSRLEVTYDRAIVHDLIDLAPPGIDEIIATVALLDAFDPDAVGGSDPQQPTYDHVIVDTAPWGHTERWLELPAHARDWVRSLLAILLEYRNVISLGDLAEDLVALSRGLGRLIEMWRDASRTAFVPVTRAAALPRLETMRMHRSLERLGIDVPAIVVDALHDERATLCVGCDRARRIEAREVAKLRAELGPGAPKLVRAPLIAVPPRGVAALREWALTWEVISK